MKRTAITLSDELAAAVGCEARRRSVSVSQILREALEAQLGRSSAGGACKPPFVALGRSGRKDTARNVGKILAAEWG